MKRKIFIILTFFLIFIAVLGCVKQLTKQFYMLNYDPNKLSPRNSANPYPIIIRLRPLSIEKAYTKPNIVYRQSAWEFDYYTDHLWAVRPADMITDLLFRHLEKIKLVETLVRRLDEKGTPDYELTGTILAIEEYNNKDEWYAHLTISFVLLDFKTGTAVYSRVFEKNKPVASKTPLEVVKVLSEATDMIASELMEDLDNVLYRITQKPVSAEIEVEEK
ncbi:MAG: ABC-type transport auxiliary lipoprotein family protein [Chitinivibrionia bacterium]|nr:ABC-type transport auxiliary lipoprotein family protein [Chitinivibrionia bacterium]